jgi:hypothetical protein
MCCNFSHEKALKEEETLLQDGTIDTSDVESKDNFLLLMSQITCCIEISSTGSPDRSHKLLEYRIV